MPQATRLDDCCTGHDACGARPLITGSGNVLINGRKAGRKSDIYQSHGCDAHATHNDEIVGGSSTVFINSLKAARVGDDISLAGTVLEGSKNVFVGG